jgi:glycerophosphoryl diester phosphodiesterase
MARPRTLLLAAVTSLACLVVATPVGAATSNLWRQSQPWNIAHQGGEDEFPSNTIYAFKKALAAGANMLELDVGVTKDNQVIVMHDTSVDRTTNGHGLISTMTLKQIKKLDGSYWFHAGDNAYLHTLPASSYHFRGIATGKKKPPKGFKRSDFQVATLAQVLKEFPHTPTNVEIKGRTKVEADSEYLQNADVLAKLLKNVHRRDLIVVSFHQKAIDRFHALDPQIPLAPGIDGSAEFLAGNSPGPGVVALQVPITYLYKGIELPITTKEHVEDAHRRGFAWQNWFSDQDVDGPANWNVLVNDCVDGVMTAAPVAFERFIKTHKRPADCV